MRPLDVRIEAALRAYDDECRWDLITGIAAECPDDVIEASAVLLRATDERSRALGADILGRLVTVEAGTRGVALPVLLDALSVEAAPAPLASIVAALGHVGDAGALGLIFPLAVHRNAEVRLAVAFAVATLSPQPLVVEARVALIRLSRDENPEVRDWATFGLGTISSTDGPDVRAALLARAEDSYRETRAEALFGLAVRRDPRAVPHLIRALQSPSAGGLEVEAAAAAADPRLLPALFALQRAGGTDELRLRRAIDRCSGRDRPELAP
jgi:HEAT repeat protein